MSLEILFRKLSRFLYNIFSDFSLLHLNMHFLKYNFDSISQCIYFVKYFTVYPLILMNLQSIWSYRAEFRLSWDFTFYVVQMSIQSKASLKGWVKIEARRKHYWHERLNFAKAETLLKVLKQEMNFSWAIFRNFLELLKQLLIFVLPRNFTSRKLSKSGEFFKCVFEQSLSFYLKLNEFSLKELLVDSWGLVEKIEQFLKKL